MKSQSTLNVSHNGRRMLMLSLLFLATLPMFAAFKTFYSKVVVNSSDANIGLVYVAKKSDATAESNYGSPKELTQNTFELTAGSTTHTYYIKARIKSELDADRYVFVGWKEGNTLISTDLETSITMTTSNSDKNNPLTRTLTAHFIEKPAIMAESTHPGGIVSVKPEQNKVGDKVTVSVVTKIQHLGNPQYLTNTLVAFEGWVDAEGNLLSTERDYTFIAEKPMTIRAKIIDLSEKPQNGKYYRIRNSVNRVLKLEGKYKFDFPGATSTSGKEADQTLLRWALAHDHNFDEYPIFTPGNKYNGTDDDPGLEVETLPSTIFYVTGKENGNDLANVVVSSQGEDTKSITGQELTLKPMNQTEYPGYYYFYGRGTLNGDAGLKMRLIYWDSSTVACEVYLGKVTDTDSYSAMALQPIDEEHMNYFWFGAKPDEAMKLEEGYWTSMYTAFPYECRDGVEAYYIDDAYEVDGNTYAHLAPIEGGKVPANTAVLLKCTGLSSKENRLLPLSPDAAVPAITGNALKGEFQLYTDNQGNGRTAFDASTMRLLGIDNFETLGFYIPSATYADAPAELTANKAYLDITALSGLSSTPESFILTTKDKSEISTGISSPSVTDSDGVRFDTNPVYDLSGRRVTTPRSGNIYIINGEKVLWR